MKVGKKNLFCQGNVRVWVLVGILGLGVLAVTVGIIRMTLSYITVHQQANSLEQNLSQTKQQINSFQQKINDQQDPAYLELQAREKFNYQLPGEHVFVFLGNTSATSSTTTWPAWLMPVVNWWRGNPHLWLDYLFKKP